MTDPELIRHAVVASELSARQFAERILSRDERTIRRWMAGTVLPAMVREWLQRWLALTPAERRAVVRSLAK